MPKAASVTIITSAMAVRTEPSSCETMEAMMRDWSFDVSTCTAT